MKKVAFALFIAVALATTAVLTHQVGKQGSGTPTHGMMGMMQGMGEKTGGEGSGQSMQRMQGMMGMMMKMMDQCSAMMGSKSGDTTEGKENK